MERSLKRKKKLRRRVVALLCGFLLLVLSVLGVLQLGCVYTANSWERWYPDYEKVDITPYLDKESLTEAEYDLLYRQTGLTRLAVDDMRDTVDGRGRILEIQETFFTKFEQESELFAPFTYTDKIKGSNIFCDLKEGDIIVTATTRVSWWRYGHAALVVKGGTNNTAIIAESIAPTYESETAHVYVYDYFADFLVYRPKLPEETKKELANYVLEEMLGLPYRFTVGILSKKNPKELKYSQCAHFVWYAYKKFGIDLDSNGGGLVKPQDLANSDKVELVQAYGFDLRKLWGESS